MENEKILLPDFDEFTLYMIFKIFQKIAIIRMVISKKLAEIIYRVNT